MGFPIITIYHYLPHAFVSIYVPRNYQGKKKQLYLAASYEEYAAYGG